MIKRGVRNRTMFLLTAIVLFMVAMGAFAQTYVNPAATRPVINQVSFTYATGGQVNQTYITIKALSGANQAAVPMTPILVYMSDSASGAGVTATASSGTVGIGTGIIAFVTAATPTVATSRIPVMGITDSVGTLRVEIVDTAKTRYYPVAILPDGRRFVGPRLATASYL